jgi:hypothetical protein
MTDKDVERVVAEAIWTAPLTGQPRGYEVRKWPPRDEDAMKETMAQARAAVAACESAVTERVRDAVIKAYIAGATDVHEHWQEDNDPDFTEAAHDYASAALTSTDAVTDAAKLGTVSLTSFDGHCVRIDFPNREDAERMYAALTEGSR